MLKSRHRSHQNKSGFTLIELLASIAILMVIVWVLAAIFRESDRAWALGTGRVDNNIEGRAILQMMSHDLQYAISDENMTFFLSDQDHPTADGLGSDTYGHANSMLAFVTRSKDASPDSTGRKTRATRELIYYVRPLGDATPELEYQYRIMRSEFAFQMLADASAHSYYNPNWHSVNSPDGNFAAENIVAFSAWVPNPDDPSEMLRNYDSSAYSNRLPMFVDIFVEVLDDEKAEQLALIKADPMMSRTIDMDKFIEENARRYTRRVHFLNRIGYLHRGDYPNRHP